MHPVFLDLAVIAFLSKFQCLYTATIVSLPFYFFDRLFFLADTSPNIMPLKYKYLAGIFEWTKKDIIYYCSRIVLL